MSKQKAEFDNLEPIALDLGKLGNTVLPGSGEYEYYLDWVLFAFGGEQEVFLSKRAIPDS